MLVNDAGQAVYTEGQIDYITAKRKVRPARGAFGDWNAYDENGNPTVTIIGSSQVFSEMDDLTTDWAVSDREVEVVKYERNIGNVLDHMQAESYCFPLTREQYEAGKTVTTVEKREYGKREDTYESDATAYAWFARKGDKVELRTERTPYNVEKVYGELPGYHRVADGTIQCWYCATTFNAKWFVKQDNEVTRNLMEWFTSEAAFHTFECYAKHNGLPLIRMMGYDGKPRHWRVSESMAGTQTAAQKRYWEGVSNADKPIWMTTETA